MHGRPTAPACVLFVCVFGVCAWKNDSVLHMHITPPLQHPCTPRVCIQVHMHTNEFEVSFYVRTCHLNFGRELLCLLQTINPLLHQLTQLLSIFVVLRLERVCECMSASVCARMAVRVRVACACAYEHVCLYVCVCMCACALVRMRGYVRAARERGWTGGRGCVSY